MADGKIFRVGTAHKTMVFVDSTNKLVHKVVSTPGDFPIYAKQLKDGGLCLFGFKNENINFIASIKNDSTVELKNTPVALDHDENADGTITLKNGNQFWSARSGGSNFGLAPRNLGWEHLSLSAVKFISTENIYTVRTFHGTQVFVDETLSLKHRKTAVANDVPLYAHMKENTLSFFVIKDNLVQYLRCIDNYGRVLLSTERYFFRRGAITFISSVGGDEAKLINDTRASSEYTWNALDDTFSVRQNDQYWSARSGNENFGMVQFNQAWEHFFLDRIDYIELGVFDVILVARDKNIFDRTVARLNTECVNVTEASLEQSDKLLSTGQNKIILLSGYSEGEVEQVSKYLESNGVAHDRIIDITTRMELTPTWWANVQYAIDNELDYFVTGDLSAAVGLDLDQIFQQKGVNLAADGQDLRQSYLTAKYIFERGRRVKFVLIGLTPDSLDDRSARNCSKRGRSLRYVLDEGDASLDEKILHSMINDHFELPSEVEPDPNLLGIKNSIAPALTKSPTIESTVQCTGESLRVLEEYARLCREYGAVPVAFILPMAASDGRLKFLRQVLRGVEKTYGLVFIDLSEIPLALKFFVGATLLNADGALQVSKVLDYRLREHDVLPMENLRAKSYEYLFLLGLRIGQKKYDAMMGRLFDVSVEELRRKARIKVGFVLYDMSMWCGNLLYDLFARDERYEVTVFIGLRKDHVNSFIADEFAKNIERLRSLNMNVVGIKTNDDVLPEQDVLIYLTPYFHYLPRAMRLPQITPRTLMVYTPYSYGIGSLSLSEYKIHFVLWKIFAVSKLMAERWSQNGNIVASRITMSGSPKMDQLYSEEPSKFEWKLARPDAVKIVWAPHWSIVGRPFVRIATFQWNYKFFYEYAKSHPETSWVVKPHPNLSYSSVKAGLFSSAAEYDQYLRQWDSLPNAKVVTGGYYQDIFLSSDGMILDSSSFVAEYMYTLKPFLFLTREENLYFEFKQTILDVNYQSVGSNFDGIAKFIDDVLINHNDTKYDARMKVFDEQLNYRKHNGMLASEMIFKTIDDALKKE